MKEEFSVSSEYGNDFISITDDEGNSYEFEHLDTMEYNDNIYVAFLPAEMDEDDEDFGVVLLKVLEDDDNQDMLVNITDEKELKEVFEQFVSRFSKEDNKEDNET